MMKNPFRATLGTRYLQVKRGNAASVNTLECDVTLISKTGSEAVFLFSFPDRIHLYVQAKSTYFSEPSRESLP